MNMGDGKRLVDALGRGDESRVEAILYARATKLMTLDEKYKGKVFYTITKIEEINERMTDSIEAVIKARDKEMKNIQSTRMNKNALKRMLDDVNSDAVLRIRNISKDSDMRIDSLLEGLPAEVARQI